MTESRVDSGIKCRILVVAPDREEGLKMKQCLSAADAFEDVIISDEATARTNVSFLKPGLILVAIPGDERRGLLMLNRLRHVNEAPIVLCSESGAGEDMVRALEGGADEYLVIPLQPAELAARLRAVLRRCRSWSAPQDESVLRAGELEIRLRERRVFRRGRPVDLTRIEFRLLVALVRRQGQLVSHAQLLEEVQPHYSIANTTCACTSYLRVKIEDDPHAQGR
jgi:DNA-binding response OmpR family regulator